LRARFGNATSSADFFSDSVVASQTFAFGFTDPNSAADIVTAQMDISGACYLYYPRGLNEMYLASDTGVWQGPLKMGSTGTLQNSQCTLNMAGS
jgi:hypothetical protein